MPVANPGFYSSRTSTRAAKTLPSDSAGGVMKNTRGAKESLKNLTIEEIEAEIGN